MNVLNLSDVSLLGEKASMRFVAVSYGSPSGIYSDDGRTWTPMAMPSALNWVRVVYGNGNFVATTFENSGYYATSQNGINWTLRQYPQSGLYWGTLNYAGGIFFSTSLYNESSPNVASIYGLTSRDGINWVQTGNYNDGLGKNYFGYGSGIWLCSGPTAFLSDSLIRSTNGVNWSLTSGSLGELAVWNNITYAKNTFLTFESFGSGCAKSTNGGNTWSFIRLPVAAYWDAIIFDGTDILAFPAIPTPEYYIANTGITAFTVSPNPLPVGGDWIEGAYKNGTYIIVDVVDGIILSSTDKKTWVTGLSPLGIGINSITVR